MDPFGPTRRSVRQRKRVTENKLSTEGEVRDDDAEGTDKDSLGPGSNPDLAHGSSGVQQIPDNESSANQPSEPDGPRSSRSEDHSMHSRRNFGEEGRPSSRRLTHPPLGSAPDKHAIPLGNSTPTNKRLSVDSRGSPHTAGSDGEPVLAEARGRHILRARRRKGGTAPIQSYRK